MAGPENQDTGHISSLAMTGYIMLTVIILSEKENAYDLQRKIDASSLHIALFLTDKLYCSPRLFG